MVPNNHAVCAPGILICKVMQVLHEIKQMLLTQQGSGDLNLIPGSLFLLPQSNLGD